MKVSTKKARSRVRSRKARRRQRRDRQDVVFQVHKCQTILELARRRKVLSRYTPASCADCPEPWAVTLGDDLLNSVLLVSTIVAALDWCRWASSALERDARIAAVYLVGAAGLHDFILGQLHSGA